MLGATRQRRYRLAGIQDPQWIETLAQRVKLVTFRIAELNAHFPELLHANPMFAGNRAAVMDAQLQDLAAELLGFLEFALFAGVIQNQRMQITVTGVKHVGDRQTVLLGELPHLGQHSRERFARDGAIDAVIIG